jgi:hypothetical protein
MNKLTVHYVDFQRDARAIRVGVCEGDFHRDGVLRPRPLEESLRIALCRRGVRLAGEAVSGLAVGFLGTGETADNRK